MSSGQKNCEALRALKLVQLGGLSAGPQRWKVLIWFQGTSATLAELRRSSAEEPVVLPGDTAFGSEHQVSQRGAAGDLSRMTYDHLRPFLSNPRDLHKLFLVAEKFSQGEIPRTVVPDRQIGVHDSIEREGWRGPRHG